MGAATARALALRGRDVLLVEHRDAHAGGGRRLPDPAETAASLGLLLGNGDRSLRVVGPEQLLRRRTALLEAVRAPEAAS